MSESPPQQAADVVTMDKIVALCKRRGFIFPSSELRLVRKDGQPELAREVFGAVRELVQAEYDDGGAIGKRYRRQDEIGTPFCVTIDHESLAEGTVTVRDRDSLTQERRQIEGLAQELQRRVTAPWKTPKLAG